MKHIVKLACIAACAMIATGAFAQEHWTEGPVREVSFYRTKPGQFDEYMKYLRANFLPQQEEAKKQGLIVDFKVMIKTPVSPTDWDVAIVTLHKNFGAALDFNQGDEDRMKAIAAKHYKTSDEKKQREMSSNRFAMREYMGTNYLREVNLKPMP
jgi:hypothetical protein